MSAGARDLDVSTSTHYRGFSLMKSSEPLGPYSRTMPRSLWCLWVGLFLMSEVPLYGTLPCTHNSMKCRAGWEGCMRRSRAMVCRFRCLARWHEVTIMRPVSGLCFFVFKLKVEKEILSRSVLVASGLKMCFHGCAGRSARGGCFRCQRGAGSRSRSRLTASLYRLRTPAPTANHRYHARVVEGGKPLKTAHLRGLQS